MSKKTKKKPKKKAKKKVKKKVKKKARRKPGKRAGAKKKAKKRAKPARRSRTQAARRRAPVAVEETPPPLVPPGKGGVLVVVSGPSGAGKTTLARRLAQADSRIWLSVSMTTRAPRPGEYDGIDYIFVTREEFERARRDGALLESATVHGESYGTPRERVVERLLQDRDVLLEIDLQGAAQVRRRVPEAVLVFVRPPARWVLETRLRERGSESDEKILSRLAAADREVRHAIDYDYLVVNDDLDGAVAEALAVMAAARCRVARRQDLPW